MSFINHLKSTLCPSKEDEFEDLFTQNPSQSELWNEEAIGEAIERLKEAEKKVEPKSLSGRVFSCIGSVFTENVGFHENESLKTTESTNISRLHTEQKKTNFVFLKSLGLAGLASVGTLFTSLLLLMVGVPVFLICGAICSFNGEKELGEILLKATLKTPGIAWFLFKNLPLITVGTFDAEKSNLTNESSLLESFAPLLLALANENQTFKELFGLFQDCL